MKASLRSESTKKKISIGLNMFIVVAFYSNNSAGVHSGVVPVAHGAITSKIFKKLFFQYIITRIPVLSVDTTCFGQISNGEVSSCALIGYTWNFITYTNALSVCRPFDKTVFIVFVVIDIFIERYTYETTTQSTLRP